MTNPFVATCLVAILVVTSGGRGWSSQDGEPEQSLKKEVRHFTKEMTTTVNLEYLLYLPSEYGEAARTWPLLLYLHGGGAWGDDLGKVEVQVKASVLDQWKSLPFVVVAPQLPRNVHWSPDALHGLLEEVIQETRIDESRVYVIGCSRGGFGTWELGVSYPEMFAAVVPMAGRGMHSVCRLQGVPVRIFHGAKDEAVPVQASESMLRNLKGCEADVKLTVYPDAGHVHACRQAFQDKELWNWMLKQSRSDEK